MNLLENNFQESLKLFSSNQSGQIDYIEKLKT